jgi:hypothetical protein
MREFSNWRDHLFFMKNIPQAYDRPSYLWFSPPLILGGSVISAGTIHDQRKKSVHLPTDPNFFQVVCRNTGWFFLALPSLSSQKHCQATQGFKYNLTSFCWYYTRSQTGKGTGYRPTLKPLVTRDRFDCTLVLPYRFLIFYICWFAVEHFYELYSMSCLLNCT